MTFKKSLRITGLGLTIGMIIISFVFAQQDQRPGRRFDQGNFDPERIQGFMLDRATSGLKLSAEETKVIVPKIQALISYRFTANQELQPLRQDLGDLVNAEKPNDKAIKQQLDKVKAKAVEIKKKADAMENDLKAVLTIQQEAQLTLRGILTNGTGLGGMGMGGFGPRGGFSPRPDRPERNSRDTN